MFLSEWREFPSALCLVGKKLMTTRVSMLLKSRASLTCFRACFLPSRVKDLKAPRYHYCVHSEKTPDDGQKSCPKSVEFYSKNKFEKLVHLVGFIIRIYHDERSPEHQYIYIYIYIYKVLLRVKEQRNILHEIRKRKANWIGHILRRNCLLKRVIEGKIK